MSTLDAARLLGQLRDLDKREDEIFGALLQHGALLEELALRERRVTVADLQELRTALEAMLAKIVRAQGAAPSQQPTNGGAPAASATVAELAGKIKDNDSEQDRLRELLAQRLRELAQVAPRPGDEVTPAPRELDAVGGRTFRVRPSLMTGGDVRSLQQVLNERFAGLRIGRRIAEDGEYGRDTREAAHQVAFCLGLLRPDLQDGITPAVRAALAEPRRRSERQKLRARGPNCRAYRAKLRARYAKHPRPRSPKPGGSGRPTGSGGVPASAAGVAAAIRAHGGRYEDLIIREAKRSRLPVALVCALVEQESGFRNVFGHDPTIYAGAGTVTKEKYLAYKRQRGPQGKGGMQGVGPCQLTWWTLQDRADELGGCWMAGPNIRVGVEHLKQLVAAHGLAGGLSRYNGSGPAARAYSQEVLRRMRVWETRLRGLSGGAPSPPRPVNGTPAPIAIGPRRPLRPGKRKLLPRGRALHWLTTHRGITEQPLGSNRDRRRDGISAAQKRIGTRVGGAWCGTWCANAALAGGVKMSQAWRWAAVKFIEDDARAARNGFRGWTRDPRSVLRGDLVVLYGRGQHVEMVRKVSRMRKIVITDGANTSSGTAGSQVNGHGAHLRKRPFSVVHGYALVDYPDR